MPWHYKDIFPKQGQAGWLAFAHETQTTTAHYVFFQFCAVAQDSLITTELKRAATSCVGYSGILAV